MKMTFNTFFLLTVLLPSSVVQASDISYSGYFNAGVEFGGDDIFEVGYTDGRTGTITAGNGFTALGGAIVRGYYFESRLGIGLKSVSQNAENGSVSFGRYTAEATAFYRAGYHKQHLIGGGLLYHFDAVAECSITAICDEALQFDSAPGFVAEYNYIFAPQTSNFMEKYTLGALAYLRYQSIRYGLTDQSGSFSVDGSSISAGVGLTWY